MNKPASVKHISDREYRRGMFWWAASAYWKVNRAYVKNGVGYIDYVNGNAEEYEL